MSSNCKLSNLNGRLPSSFKLKKAKEPPNSVRKWRRKFVSFMVFVTVVVGSLWVFLSCDNGTLRRRNDKATAESCEEEKVQMLLQHFNVTQKEPHALANFFSESDQVSSLKCVKEAEAEMHPSDGISCALKVQSSKKLEFQKERAWNAEYIGDADQCPALDENFPRRFHLPLLGGETLPVASQSTVSPMYHDCEQVQGCAKDHYGIFSCLMKYSWWIILAVLVSFKFSGFNLRPWNYRKLKLVHLWRVPCHQSYEPVVQQRQSQQVCQQRQLQPLAQKPQLLLQHKQQQQAHGPPRSAGTWSWRKNLLIGALLSGVCFSGWLYWHLSEQANVKRVDTLANMCDERARMLQDQFNVSMNHVNALAILISTFYHGTHPSAIDQKTFREYTERTAFERPLTSGVAYALKVPHSERAEFEKQQGWTIKKMGSEDQRLGQDCIPENLESAPVQDEYAPVILTQETVSHIISIDMMSGKEDRENILRARASGKGVLTSPFKLLKSNHLGVVLTFAVYNSELPPHATPEQRVEASVGYLGASYDVPSLVDKLLHQLASKQTIVVHVYDTTNAHAPITMYGSEEITDTGLLHISSLDFGDPMRKHEMHCRFKHKAPFPLAAINSALGVLVITFLLGYIFHAAINRIAEVEDDYRKMTELKVRAEAADVAKSQFLATVSHEIRTPMFGVLGMLQMLMDTELDANQLDYAQIAHASGKDLISLINEVLDQAKIESGRLELEAVSFDLRAVLDNVISLFSGRSNERKIQLAVYVSNQVPEVVNGDPGRFQQIITNLVGNSIKFTNDRGHIFVSVHLANEVRTPCDAMDEVLRQGLTAFHETPNQNHNTLSGLPVVNRWKSWENFKDLNSTDTIADNKMIRLLVTVEDTGAGIPLDAQKRIFTPFMQADSSTSRTHGGTGIGLSISRCLVGLMHGEIDFVSEPGIGSTFSFTVCLRKAENSFVDTKWQQLDPATQEFRGLRALVVDNSCVRAEVTRYHLQRLGISADVTSSVESAYSHISSSCHLSALGHFSMVLIDKDVWDKDSGSKIFDLSRNNTPNGGLEVRANPKIFLLANSISPIERREIKSVGIENVLIKPLRLSVMTTCLHECLGNARKRQISGKKPTTVGNLLKDKRILVVDDNRVNRRVAEAAIKKYGAIVTCVESGKAALEMLTPPHNFDACFMDLQMPEMDGFEATRQIRRIEAEVNERLKSGQASIEMFNNLAHWQIPILAMTADVTQASNDECKKCGMNDYVSKPFEEEQLYSAISRVFQSG